MTLKIAMLQTLTPEIAARVAPLVPAGFRLEVTRSTDLPDLLAVIADADYAVAFGMTVPEAVLRAAPRLRLLHRWGTGLDGVPLELCRDLGIVVARAAGCNARPVAEFTVGAMLASSRMLTLAHAAMQEGRWIKKQLWMQNVMLSGRRVGLVGLGAIGREVAIRLRGFGCDVLYTKRNRLAAAEEQALGVRHASLDEVLEADIVSLHCPLDASTRHLIGREQLARMQPHAILVNTARGGLVDEAALAEALRSGRIRSAVIDVFEQEPIAADNPLLHLDNAILTPHVAANSLDNLDHEIGHWMGNIRAHAEGRPLPPADLALP
jgi:phosphoglycerate dehydrogenase-like enzyme